MELAAKSFPSNQTPGRQVETVKEYRCSMQDRTKHRRLSAFLAPAKATAEDQEAHLVESGSFDNPLDAD